MRKLIALVFHYSLNGLLADKCTEYYQFCFDLLDQAGGPDQDEQSLDFSRARTRTSWAAPPTRAWPQISRRTPTIRGPTS